MEEPLAAFVCGFSEDSDGGIYSYRIDDETGKLEHLCRTPIPGTTFLADHPDGTHIYSANRVSGGEVTAFYLDNTPGKLIELNRQPSNGAGPAYISVDDTGNYAFVANYTGGTITMLPIKDDGRLGNPTDTVQHNEASLHTEHQQEPHPHSICPGPKNQFLYVPDLGLDKVMIYRIDFDNGKLHAAEPSYVELHAGAGPRHIVFHPNEQFAFVINELDSTITTFEYDHKSGALDEIETVDALPPGFDEESYCADIHIHPSGQWLYGSNRGHNSIAIFSIVEETGRLELVGHESTNGDWPRDFEIDPIGRYLYVENRRSNSIIPFTINESSGDLAPTGDKMELPEPICMKIMAPNK